MSTIAYPRLCTLSHPSSNLWGESVENAIRTGGGDIWTRLHGNRGWLTGSASNPPLCYLLLSTSPPLPPNTLFYVYLSAVQWLRSLRFAGAIRLLLTQYLFIIRPSGPQDRAREAEPHLLCSANVFCIRKG